MEETSTFIVMLFQILLDQLSIKNINGRLLDIIEMFWKVKDRIETFEIVGVFFKLRTKFRDIFEIKGRVLDYFLKAK